MRHYLRCKCSHLYPQIIVLLQLKRKKERNYIKEDKAEEERRKERKYILGSHSSPDRVSELFKPGKFFSSIHLPPLHSNIVLPWHFSPGGLLEIIFNDTPVPSLCMMLFSFFSWTHQISKLSWGIVLTHGWQGLKWSIYSIPLLREAYCTTFAHSSS